MRVLFIDSNEILFDLLPHGFREAGHHVKVSGRITKEADIKALIDEFKPHLVVTNGWGPEQTLEKQVWIKNQTKSHKIPHVYWSVEDPIFTNHFVLPLVNTAQPEFIFTICQSAVNFYRSIGFPTTYLDWGVQPSTNYPIPPVKQYEVDIAIVANSYYRTLDQFVDFRIESMKQLIEPLVTNGIRVDIWGEGWDKIKPFLGVEIPSGWIRGVIPFSECNKVYSSAKMMIGLQNMKTQVTQRTYEILGSGGFLLTNDTPAIRRLFVPGRDLVVTSSPEETLRIVDFYLNNQEIAKTIRSQGLKEVTRHTYRRKAEFIIETLSKHGIL
ncbi:CgeB family protein [Brevibacillus ginsengisoli]|uniref:CgeB family protein n=1 Tax=Brevibacillus ginsengisoli TaxID=363854 RepID=UPI003CF7D522